MNRFQPLDPGYVRVKWAWAGWMAQFRNERIANAMAALVDVVDIFDCGLENDISSGCRCQYCLARAIASYYTGGI